MGWTSLQVREEPESQEKGRELTGFGPARYPVWALHGPAAWIILNSCLGQAQRLSPSIVKAHILQSPGNPWLAWSGPGNTHIPPASGSVCGKTTEVLGQTSSELKVVVGAGVREGASDLAEALGVGVIPRSPVTPIMKVKGEWGSPSQI